MTEITVFDADAKAIQEAAEKNHMEPYDIVEVFVDWWEEIKEKEHLE